MKARLATILLLTILFTGLCAGMPAWSGPLTPGGAAAAGEIIPPSAFPEPLRDVVQGFNRVQAEASRAMNRQLQSFRDQGSVAAAAWLCLIGFAYGVLHAVGPGHGKVVVSSYFVARRARISRGLMLAAGAALTQALSAILLVGIPVLALGMSRSAVMGQTRTLELLSYGLMTVLGLVMLVRGRRNGDCCGHGQADQPARRCEHDHGHGHEHEPAHEPSPRSDRKVFGLLALAVGCRPCSGAVILLLFALANDMALVGILAVLAMALGVAITTSAAGLFGMGLRTMITAATGSKAQVLAAIERGLGIAGGLFIAGLGGLLFLATLAQA